MKQENNTRGLRMEMAKLLGQAEAWFIVTKNKGGDYQLHTPNEDQAQVIAEFLLSEYINDPDNCLYTIVGEMIDKLHTTSGDVN